MNIGDPIIKLSRIAVFPRKIYPQSSVLSPLICLILKQFSLQLEIPIKYILPFIILVILGACQTTSVPIDEQMLPTRMQFPTDAPTIAPSDTPMATFTATLSPTPTATDIIVRTSTLVPTATTPSVILLPSFTPSHTPPAITRTPLPTTFIFGQSVQGRDLIAYRFGTGRHWIMLVGGIHAGFEANTIALMEQLRLEWQNNPREILPEVSFIVIPRLNPDGESRGRIIEGRFNGNGVDLNRNWGCGWEESAEFANGPVDPGFAPFDQPETAALAALIQEVQPSAVLFYHSAANGVFAGGCGDNPNLSDDLAQVYGTASNYPFGAEFEAYEVSGTGPAWVNSIGIPSLDVELASDDVTEFDRNLRALQAVQRWIAAR